MTPTTPWARPVRRRPRPPLDLATARPSAAPTTKRGRRVPTARRLRGCSRRRPSALRVCRAARRRVLALTAQGRRHTIRPATPLPRPPGRDRHGRTRRGIRRMTRPPALVAAPLVAARPLASWNLSECAWTYSAPLRCNPLRLPAVHAAKTAGQEARRGEGAGCGAISNQMILRLFLEIQVHQIGRKATTPTKASSRVPQEVDAEGERPGRVAESPASHSSRLGVRHSGRRRTPRELSAVSTRGQADAQRGQSVGSTVSSECRRSTGLPGGETRSSVRASDSARISSACAEGSSLPPFRSSGNRGSARLRTRFASGSSRMSVDLPDCGRSDTTPRRPRLFSQRNSAGHSSRVNPP
jgi:hypothetical protein